MLTIEEAQKKYRAVIWDRKSPINGVPAEIVLANRNDIIPDGEIYLVISGDQVLYFQPCVPGAQGFVKMTKEDAINCANKDILRLAQADVVAAEAALNAEKIMN